MALEWKPISSYKEATLGDFYGHDGVRFTLEFRPTCHRRGPWRLLVEATVQWGCFDDQDQPMRYYHHERVAYEEAEAIADVLLKDQGAMKP